MWFWALKTTRPVPSRYPKFLSLPDPIPSRSQKPLPVSLWSWPNQRWHFCLKTILTSSAHLLHPPVLVPLRRDGLLSKVLHQLSIFLVPTLDPTYMCQVKWWWNNCTQIWIENRCRTVTSEIQQWISRFKSAFPVRSIHGMCLGPQTNPWKSF